jgi:hypothetical protein
MTKVMAIFHGLFHNKVPIFGTEEHLAIPNNIIKISFYFSCKNIIFKFLSAKMRFCDANANNMVQYETCPISHNVEHI